MVVSFPRKREPSQIKKLDSRFRGNDDLCFPECGNRQTHSSGASILLTIAQTPNRIEKKYAMVEDALRDVYCVRNIRAIT